MGDGVSEWLCRLIQFYELSLDNIFKVKLIRFFYFKLRSYVHNHRKGFWSMLFDTFSPPPLPTLILVKIVWLKAYKNSKNSFEQFFLNKSSPFSSWEAPKLVMPVSMDVKIVLLLWEEIFLEAGKISETERWKFMMITLYLKN